MLTRSVDEETCNPLALWHGMGEPASLSDRQKKLLREAAVPAVHAEMQAAEDGMLLLSIRLKEYGVIWFEASPARLCPDRGYDYERVI